MFLETPAEGANAKSALKNGEKMLNNFMDIRMVSVDAASTRRSDYPGMYDLAILLSDNAPMPWINYFDEAWQQHTYVQKGRQKARVAITGNALTITCVPERFESEHKGELQKIIAETNKKYGDEMDRLEAQRIARDLKEEADEAALAKAIKGIRFD
jgi:hypothetical protein